MKKISILTFTLLAALACVVRAGETAPAPIPFSDLGAKATADYQGEAIGIEATADGARLRTAFQKLSGSVTREGLWLESTEAGGGRLRLIAEAIGRALVGKGLSVQVLSIEDVSSADGFDAVVLGSAMYLGRWLKPAKEFVQLHHEALAARSTWLFPAGPSAKARNPIPVSHGNSRRSPIRRISAVTGSSRDSRTVMTWASARSSRRAPGTCPKATSGRGPRSRRGRTR